MNSKSDPLQEYESRLAQRMQTASACERAHIRTGNGRLLFLIDLIALVATFCRTGFGIGVGLLALMIGLFISGMIHDRILNARDLSRRSIRFYEWARLRLSANWAGKGSPGS